MSHCCCDRCAAGSLERILYAAHAIGREKGPEHEIYDLQDALKNAWQIMSADQREDLLGLLAAQLEPSP